ncbi:hypothetical protein MTQ01_19260 [Streptomyces sp. XM4193]|uniref:hypothetical protein n=1 Tax=Streptomyces sp. XM4193 TaxID=2929782 RepID=UPI001FFB330C|nr:hypothetical protein [Streptomyces sp. XM4193]MCK1798128.1 hypothetical protein [Streptomyces sp. XM4193]
MKKILEFLAFVLFLQGAGLLVHHFVGWFDLLPLAHRLPFVEGHEVPAAVLLLAAALGVGMASDRVRG